MTKDIKIQLYKEDGKGIDGYLTLTESSDFPFTISLGDIKDVSKRTATLSKSIKLGGTKENNNILNHYYDVNVESLDYNVNVLQKCRVLINGEIIYDNCVMQLIEINKTQPNGAYEFNIEYTVQIKSESANFFDNIKNKELTDIKFGTKDIPNNADPAHMTYEPYWIINSFNNDYTDGYKMLMQQTTNDEIGLPMFKPSIYVWQYWNRIIADAGYRYTFNEIGVQNSVLTNPAKDDLKFRKLLLPYTDKLEEGTFETVNYYRAQAEMDIANAPITLTGYTSSKPDFVNQGWITKNVAQSSPTTILPIDITIWDESLSYSDSTYEYTSDFAGQVDVLTNQSYDIFFNTLGGTDDVIVKGSTNAYARIRIVNELLKNNVPVTNNIYNSPQGVGGSYDLQFNQTINAGRTLIGKDNAQTTWSVSVVPGDKLKIRTRFFIYEPNFGNHSTFVMEKVAGGRANNFRFEIDMWSQQLEFRARIANGGLMYGNVIDFNNYKPKKVKQSDFLKSLLNMFNLFVEVDKNDPNLLIFNSRDNFYNLGTTHDWTNKLVKEEDQNVQFLSEITNKQKYFTYKQDKYILNEQYVGEYIDTYGSARFTFENEFVKDEDKLELIFSPSPIINQNGRYLTDLSTEGSLRILLDGGIANTSFNIRGWAGSGTVASTTYPITTHFDSPTNPQYDINFGACFTYYYNFNSLTENNLLNTYWRRTLHQINTSRILTATFVLSEQDIKNVKLNDLIYIDNAYWYINKISDFNPVKTYKTKVELISIDDLQSTSKGRIISVGGTRPTKPWAPSATLNPSVFDNIVLDGNTGNGNTGVIIGGFGNTVKEYTTTIGNDNVNMGIGGSIFGNNVVNTGIANTIVGNNNAIFADASTVVGENNNVTGAGALVSGDDNNIETGGIYFGSNINVPASVGHAIVVGNGITPTQPGIYTDYLNVDGVDILQTLEDIENEILDLDFTDLNDTPSTYASNANRILQVNPATDGVQFANFTWNESTKSLDFPTQVNIKANNGYISLQETTEGHEIMIDGSTGIEMTSQYGITINSADEIDINGVMRLNTNHVATPVKMLGIGASNDIVRVDLPTPTVNKYVQTLTLNAGNNVITHNLNDINVIVQVQDSSGNVFIPNAITSFALNTVTINVLSSIPTAKVIILK